MWTYWNTKWFSFCCRQFNGSVAVGRIITGIWNIFLFLGILLLGFWQGQRICPKFSEVRSLILVMEQLADVARSSIGRWGLELQSSSTRWMDHWAEMMQSRRKWNVMSAVDDGSLTRSRSLSSSRFSIENWRIGLKRILHNATGHWLSCRNVTKKLQKISRLLRLMTQTFQVHRLSSTSIFLFFWGSKVALKTSSSLQVNTQTFCRWIIQWLRVTDCWLTLCLLTRGTQLKGTSHYKCHMCRLWTHSTFLRCWTWEHLNSCSIWRIKTGFRNSTYSEQAIMELT